VKLHRPPGKEVVPVEGYVELSTGHVDSFKRRDCALKASSEGRTPGAQPHEDEMVHAAILLDDLMRHAREGAAHLISIQNDLDEHSLLAVKAHVDHTKNLATWRGEIKLPSGLTATIIAPCRSHGAGLKELEPSYAA
jgi:hypothetical protein